MKNNIFLHLGRLIVLGVLSLTACQVVGERELLDQRVSYDCTLIASVPQTRTANDAEDYRIVSWVANDALTVLHTETGEKQYYGSRFYYSGENNAFKGGVQSVAATNDWYILYPYDEDNVDPTQMRITVDNAPVQEGNDSFAHLSGEGFPLYGKQTGVDRSTPLNIDVHHTLAYLRLKFDYDDDEADTPLIVKNIVFAAPVQVCGPFVGDLTADDVVWTPEESASKNITLTVNNGTEIGAGDVAFFYAGSIPFTLQAGASVKVKITFVKASEPETEIVRYKLITFNKDSDLKPGLYKTVSLVFSELSEEEPEPDGPSTIKQDQTLAFANDAITWTLGDVYALNGEYEMPQTVAGAQTAVTYESSKPGVVAITDGGKFKIVSVGTTTITAKAAETTEWNPSEKSYTLTVAEAAVVPSSRTYTYVSPSSLSAGTYVIAGSESNELSVALFPTVTSGSWNSTSSGQVSGQYIPHKVVGTNNSVSSFTTEDADIIAAEVELVKDGSSWKIKVNSTGLYLSAPADEYVISFGAESSAASFAISSGTSATQAKAGDYYFYHSGSADGFTLRKTSTSNLRFYKLDSNKQSQTISFASQNVEWTLGTAYELEGTYSIPQVNGAVTAVTYSSSNTSVATIVDGTKVKIHKAGSTTITASAAETTSYLGATATMTLTIKESGSSTPTTETIYKKVTEEPTSWDGTYLFVDETSGKAFAAFSANASSYATSVTIVTNGNEKYVVSDGQVDKYALTVSDAGVKHGNSAANNQEAYHLKNSDGKYLYWSQSALQISDTNTRDNQGQTLTYYHAFKYDSGVQVLSANSSSSGYAYYLGYTSSSFNYSRESADGRRIQLYKLTSGGTTPTPPSPDKQNQTVTFSQSQKNVTWTLGDTYKQGSSYAAQTPGGDYHTSLVYTSSNEGVVTVNGSNLKIVGTGTTTITATAQESDTYNAASDTYTLKVEAASTQGTTRTYTYQSSASAGTYLLGGYESGSSSSYGGQSSEAKYSIALFPTVLIGDWTSSQGPVTNGQYLAQRDITSSTTLTFTDDSEIFNAEVELIASGSNWKIKIKSTGKYLAVPSADNRIVYVDTESSATAFSISGSSSNSVGISSGSYYFYHSGSAQGFSMRAYQVTNIRLYKLTSEGSSSGTKQDQNLSFANSSVTWTLGNGYNVGSSYDIQALTGAKTTVTYTSSNTNVATIQSGRIRIVGTGSTTIKATAESNDQYNAAVAQYTLIISDGSTPSGSAVYVKASALTVGGTYLVVDVADQRLMTGNSDGSFVSVSPSNGVITDSNGTMSAYEFTITESGSKYCILKDGKYLICDYSQNGGNNSTGLVYESQKPSDTYLYTYTVNNGVFEFKTAQRNSSSTSEVLYYKTSSNVFKIGGSGVGVGVHLYQKDGASGKQVQNLSFANSAVTLTLENASGTYQVQTVSGNKTTPVTYTSLNSSVATVSGTTITIKGFGSTEITAKAPANDDYYEATKSYTLYVNRASQAGVWNLENDCVYNYLNEATTSYTAANHSSTTLISGGSWGNSGPVYSYNGTGYTPSSSNRWDCPKPVTITWTSSVSGSKDVYVYTDAAHTQPVNYIDQPISVSSSSNSVDVYNLIPEKAGNRLTYYYVVKSGNSEVASGEFTTEGRRRMMKINASFTSQTYTENRANNCRDFGGQVTTSGKHIKFGKIYRGSNMDSTTDDEKKIIKQYMNIGLDVDLRGDSERNNPLNFAQISKYDADVYEGHTQEDYSGTQQLNDATHMAATLTRVMNAVVNNVNVYIHCRVGADRTGYTCMMLEAILGVPLERCDMDYEMTSFSVVGVRKRTSDGVNYYHSGVSQINNQSGSTYQEKAVKYATDVLGIPSSLITAFQNAMLE